VATRQGVNTARGASPAQIREAERSLKRKLRRHFSAAWISEHANDLLNQAHVEYAEWLEKNPPARSPVGWLIHCAYWRAINLLDAEKRKPATASLESGIQLPDQTAPSPEQQILDLDRRERLQAALGFLPEKERKLLALVYYDGHSIREAGRKLGWQKSPADRHHRDAMAKLRALVGEDRSLLTPRIVGLTAWMVTYGEQSRLAGALDAALTPGREALVLLLDAGQWSAHQLAELWRRVASFADPANAAASGSSGRLVGACGVAALSVVCGITASGVAPSAGTAIDQATPAFGPPSPARSAPNAVPAPELAAPAMPTPPRAEPTPVRTEAPRVARAREPKTHERRAPARRAPTAEPEQVVEEFGIEGGSGSTPRPAPEPTASPSPSPPSSSSPQRGSSEPSSEGSSGSQTAREFGL
jgi:RNA polymerase sigma factor (sigma-70 family)